MPIIRAQVVIPMRTNLPRDVATNTFHFYRDESATFEEDADALTPWIEDLYQAIYTAGIASYYNCLLAHINFYDMSTAPPRIPYTKDILRGASEPVTTNTIVPNEVACCVSFQGVPLPGVSQARRRGRIFLPGLGAAAQMTASSGTSPYFPRWSSAFLVTLDTAFSTFLTNLGSVSSPLLFWGVYSPTAGTIAPVQNGWIDDTPDTQRRRGVRTETRTIFTAA